MTPAKAYWHVKNLALLPWYALTKTPRRLAPVPKRILVIGYAAIGDFIFFMPALEDMRAAYPHAHITYLANDSVVTRELVRPLVDAVWKADWEGHQEHIDDINERIVAWQFDMVLLTQASPAHYFQKGLASVPWRVGHISLPSRRSWKQHVVAGEPARWLLLDRRVIIGKDAENPVTRNLRLNSRADLTPRAPYLNLHTPAPENSYWPRSYARPRIAVHLGQPGNQYRKMWAPKSFGKMCAAVSFAKGALEVFVIGGIAEDFSYAEFRREYPFATSFIGQMDLRGSMALMRTCDLVVGNDTGPLKAAAAIGVPTLTLLGPTSLNEVGIPWPGPHTTLNLGKYCSPCVSGGIAKQQAETYLNCDNRCMNFTPEMVAQKVLNILRSL